MTRIHGEIVRIGIEIAPAAKGRAPHESAAFFGCVHAYQRVTQMAAVVGQAADRAGEDFARKIGEACLRRSGVLHQYCFEQRIVDTQRLNRAGGQVSTEVLFNPELKTSWVMIPAITANGPREVLNYSRSYTSWTAGALWKANANTSLFVRASRGVILATGGFVMNEEMRRRYCPGEMPVMRRKARPKLAASP